VVFWFDDIGGIVDHHCLDVVVILTPLTWVWTQLF